MWSWSYISISRSGWQLTQRSTLISIIFWSYFNLILCCPGLIFQFSGAVGSLHSPALWQEQDGRDHSHEENPQGFPRSSSWQWFLKISSHTWRELLSMYQVLTKITRMKITPKVFITIMGTINVFTIIIICVSMIKGGDKMYETFGHWAIYVIGLGCLLLWDCFASSDKSNDGRLQKCWFSSNIYNLSVEADLNKLNDNFPKLLVSLQLTSVESQAVGLSVFSNDFANVICSFGWSFKKSFKSVGLFVSF